MVTAKGRVRAALFGFGLAVLIVFAFVLLSKPPVESTSLVPLKATGDFAAAANVTLVVEPERNNPSQRSEPGPEERTPEATPATTSTPKPRPPVRVLPPATELKVLVLSSTGKPVEGATLALDVNQYSMNPAIERTYSTSNAQGEATFRRIEPDRYSLGAYSQRHADLEIEDVSVVQGENRTTVHLEPLPSDGNIVCSILMPAGVEEADGSIALQEVGVEYGARTFWKDLNKPNAKTGQVLTFVFEDIPNGDYVATPIWWDMRPINPAFSVARPGGGECRFMCDEVERFVEVTWQASAAGTGRELGGATFMVESIDPALLNPDCYAHTISTSGDSFQMRLAISPTRRVLWSVWRQGYEPMFGELLSVPSGQEEVILKCPLGREWSRRLQVVRRQGVGVTGVQGASVFINGEHCGVTDTIGVVTVKPSEPPETIKLRIIDSGGTILHDAEVALDEFSVASRCMVEVK